MPDGQKHLLIVDDETALREAVAERLSEHGFAVEQADSGEQALQRLAEYAFDIILTDLRLPGIDGRQVLDAALEWYPDIIAIVIAGYGTTGQEETALSAMILGLADTHAHWVLLLSSLSAYELALATSDAFVGKTGVLARDGAAALVADALERGAACTGDFSVIDHLALAHLPLAEVREQFGVPQGGATRW